MSRIWMVLLVTLITTPVVAVVPITGRHQHMIYPLIQVQKVAARAYHLELSRLQKRHELDTNPKVLREVRKICSRLIAQAVKLRPAAASWPWEIHITSDPDVAAHSMSGGKILVSTYFIKHYHLTYDELAVVLAHEIGHVIAEHVREQVSMAASFNKSIPPRSRTVSDVIGAMQSDISIYLRLMPLFRLQEMEADDIGIQLAARAGIPPSAVVSFYSKLAQSKRVYSVFDTHGPVAQRVEFVDSMANYARPVYEASQQDKLLPIYDFTPVGR